MSDRASIDPDGNSMPHFPVLGDLINTILP